MAKHMQRQRFDHPDLAKEAAEAFNDPQWKIPGVTIVGESCEIDGEYWVYVVQHGDIVIGDEPLLPNYEKVASE